MITINIGNHRSQLYNITTRKLWSVLAREEKRESDGRLRGGLQYELVMVHVDDLLREAEVRESDHLAEKEDISLTELKEEAGLDTAGEKDVTDEGPVLDWNILLLVLREIRQFS